MSDFDPANHKYPESRYFEDFEIGERFYIPSRTMTSGLFAAFQAASGDNHPIHYDKEFCRRHGHHELLAHGLQVFIQSCAGAGVLAHVMTDGLKGMLEASCRILGPVYLGDTLYPELVVSEMQPQNTTGILTVKATIHNQDSKLVMEGMHRYLLGKRPA